jgi:hypothetical protein
MKTKLDFIRSEVCANKVMVNWLIGLIAKDLETEVLRSSGRYVILYI